MLNERLMETRLWLHHKGILLCVSEDRAKPELPLCTISEAERRAEIVLANTVMVTPKETVKQFKINTLMRQNSNNQMSIN